jgi:hypothetical protein
MARARVTPARRLVESPYADQAAAASQRSMAREAKCPETFEGRLAWLARVWALEPMPEAIHGAGVFFGPPDREGCPEQAQLGAAESSPSDLVGGSVLGSPRILDAFRRYVEEGRTRIDKDGFYIRPLAAAVSRLEKGGRRRPPRPRGATFVWGVLISRGDWHGVGRCRGMDTEEARDYLASVLAVLWEVYASSPAYGT